MLSLELTSAIRPKDGFITTEFKIKNIDATDWTNIDSKGEDVKARCEVEYDDKVTEYEYSVPHMMYDLGYETQAVLQRSKYLALFVDEPFYHWHKY